MLAAKHNLNVKLNLISATFKSPELEHSYRQHYFYQDRLQAMIAISLVTVPLTAFAYSDYQFFGISSQFYKLITVRIFTLLSSLISALILLRLNDNQERGFNRVMFLWAMAICSCTLYIGLTRPTNYAFHLAIDISLLLSLYVFFPNRLPLQIISAFYFTAGSMIINLFLRTQSPISTRAIWVSFLFINLCGLWVCWRSHWDRRTQFDSLMNEKKLTDELKEALESVKTLKRLLPICSSCKKIRDDEGYWHQVEVYIHDHTDVNFSHGICPDCIQRLYPKTAAKKKA